MIVAGVIGAEKLLDRDLPAPDWVPFAVAGAMGMLVASGFAIFSGPSRLDAAVAIDRVFHLNERLSSALTPARGPARDPRGSGPDRRLRAEGHRPGRRRRVRPAAPPPGLGRADPRHGLALLLFAPAWVRNTALAKTISETVDTKALAKQAQALSKKIASQRQVIDKEKFPEADKLLAQIQKKTDELTKAPPAAKDKLMVELNSLTDALKERQKQLGSPEQVNRQLKQLKEMGSQGPADEFAKDLARGDFKKAAEELKKLQEKLASGKMTEAEKKALKEQLGEMAKKLNDLANIEQRKKQLEEARKNGGLSQQQYRARDGEAPGAGQGPQAAPAARQQDRARPRRRCRRAT